MKTAVLKPAGGLEFRDMPKPTPAPDEALLRVLVCGICSSDIGAYKNGLGTDYILGHEVVAVIEEIAPNDRGFTVNDRVTGQLLEGYGEYTVAKIEDLVKVPASLSDEEAIVEPLVCLLSGLERLPLHQFRSAAVVGTGYMGLALIRLLSAAGIPDITAVDLKPNLFPLSLEMGANRAAFPQDCDPDSFDVVFEVAGAAQALSLSASLCRPYGTLVIVGYHPYPMELNIKPWQEKGLSLLNSFENRPEMQKKYIEQAIAMVDQGSFPAKRLMTHQFAFEQLSEAFAVHIAKPDGYLKSYVRIS